MTNFTGAALYTKEEIGKALDNYAIKIDLAEEILKRKVLEAEIGYEPSVWDRLRFIKTLKEKYEANVKSDPFRGFLSYEGWLMCRGYMTLTKQQSDLSQSLQYFVIQYAFSPEWLHMKEYNQVKNLYNGGKDCYLNPEQAEFVNRFKKETTYVD